jgi:nucleoside-diphosphate-sugar epimerase
VSKARKIIAVTGSTGFVGSHLVRSLSDDGHEVKAFGRTAKPPQLLQKYAAYHQWNITEQAKGDDFSVANIFIHTAGFVDFWGDKKDIYQANVAGTRHAIKLAQQMGAKTFIYISSASVYDPRANKINMKETTPYAKRYLNYYAETKVEAEKLLKAARGFDSVAIIRPHAIYGPGDRTVVPQIISRVKHHRFILPGKGNTKYSITHVGNIVDAIRQLIQAPPKGICTLNITDNEPVEAKVFLCEVLKRLDRDIRITTIPHSIGLGAAYVIESCAKLIGTDKPPLLTVNIISQLHHESTMSIDRAKKLIGYTAKHNYLDGLGDTFKWIDSLGGAENINGHDSQLSWSGKINTY